MKMPLFIWYYYCTYVISNIEKFYFTKNEQLHRKQYQKKDVAVDEREGR